MTFSDPLQFAALEFLSLPMLGWLAAATLPWLIHRLYRRQHCTMSWAAVELLLSAMQQRARRVQMQQWLLIVLRTAILLLVALAAAEPIWQQWAWGANSSAQVHRIIVIDQSYSMGCDQQGTSRWSRAVKQARDWIENSEGAALTLIGWSQQSENLLGRPTFDRTIALAALDNLQHSNTSTNLEAAAQNILAAIQRAKNELPQLATQHVVFCTDLSRQTWEADVAEQQLLTEIAQQADVTIVNVAQQHHHNVAVTDLRIDPAITLQQRETDLVAKLSCFGKPEQSNVLVQLLIAGDVADEQLVELQADGDTTVRFTRRFVDPGEQTVQVLLADQNHGLTSDDSRWLVVDVRPQLRVACFAGQPGAVDDLVRTLAPRQGLAENFGTYAPEIFSASQLSELNLSDYAAVLISSTLEWSPREVANLAEYVRNGGALAFFLGKASEFQVSDDLQKLLPVSLEEIKQPGEYRFDPLGYRHSVTTLFRGQTQAGLLSVAVSQYRRMQLLPNSSTAEVVFAFNTGDPALVVDRFGLGRVAVCALPAALKVRTAASTPWSSFALSPSFLPVVRELVAYLVGDRWLQRRNLEVDEVATFPAISSGETTSVRLPSGAIRALPSLNAEDQGQQIFRETSTPGIYSFSVADNELARFAVNLDGRDSDLTILDPTELPAGFVSENIPKSSARTAAIGNFPLVRALLAGALVLLLLETGLAFLLGRGWS